MVRYPVFPEKVRRRCGDSLRRSLEREFHCLDGVVARAVRIQFLGRSYTYNPARDIKISSTLFRKYSCLDYPGCHICCTGYWCVFQLHRFPAQAGGKVPVVGIQVRVEEQGFNYFGINHQDPKTDCPFYTDNRCGIHSSNPISCMLPLRTFRFRKGVLTIGKSLFGRNWALGCPVKFGTYSSLAEFCEDTLPVFHRFASYLDDLHIPHMGWKIVDLINGAAERRFNTVV